MLDIVVLPPRRRQFSASYFYCLAMARIYLFSSDREEIKQNSGKRMRKKKRHAAGEAARPRSLRARPLPFSVLVQCLDHRLDKYTEITNGILCRPNAREPSHAMSHTKNYMRRGDINLSCTDR
ncbi:hypothetical protein EVAR_27474_1 [Eumeta japonica]|uniref:Uncharacterized protein n=1 Tax=Eumeta variegata TaxID=151549 RepID=A0A4C1XHA1_EUMVA|nr:hypothetical protein EVAR_27474_1 [Eumeta japonica]